MGYIGIMESKMETTTIRFRLVYYRVYIEVLYGDNGK